MNGHETSDPAIVAVKPANADGRPGAEAVEPRAGAEGNAARQRTLQAQDRASVTQGLDRVRQVAREKKKERFTTLLHHISPALLRLSFFALKREAAPGVDGMTWRDYAEELELRLCTNGSTAAHTGRSHLVRIQDPVNRPTLDPDHQRIMLAAPRPEPVGEPEKTRPAPVLGPANGRTRGPRRSAARQAEIPSRPSAGEAAGDE